MSWPYLPYFTEREMACRCGCGMQVQDQLMKILTEMRKRAGFEFIVSSGARCPKYNQEVAETGAAGPHTTGLAVDIRINGSAAVELIRLALTFGMTGIGVRQKGEWGTRFIHLDCIARGDKIHPRPWIWSY